MTASEGAMRMGKYEMGRTLGEGHFGKVRLARHTDTGRAFAIKILDRQRILAMKIDEQIKTEIATLKLLKHPNVVRLYEVAASKTKIYMVLEYVNGGELFEKIALKGKLSEKEGRKLFQQLMDAISYCHERGVYHRDLKPENVLVDAKGNIKVSDFGLSALPQHQRKDGLLHTTCGSPNYIAPEVLLNKGYDGSMSDIWSCGVILYVMLTGNLPFDDENMVVLYQKILKGDYRIPKWLSPGAQDILRKLLDPNPITRFGMDGIRVHDWFNQSYTPAVPFDDDDDNYIGDDNSHMTKHNGIQDNPAINQMNAFQLIGMSSCLDLSGFFEKEVKAAYRRMVMESHPDRVPTHQKPQAESKFKQIVEAYSCLKDGRRSGNRMEVHVMRYGVPTGYGRSNRTLVKAPFLLIICAAVSFGSYSASRAYQRQKEVCSSQNPFLP